MEVERGSGSGRGAPASQDPSLVRRLRDRAGQSRLPARRARLLGPRPGRLGRCVPLGAHRSHHRAGDGPLLGACGDVPEQVGGIPDLRERGLAQVHDDRRSDRHIRLLDRLVGRARVPRLVLAARRAGGVVPERAVRDERIRRRPDRRRVLQYRQRPHRASAPDRDRDHSRRLGVQRLRDAHRRGLQLPGGRPADDPALLLHDPPVPQRRLRLGQPHLQAQRPGARLGRLADRPRVDLDHDLVGGGCRHVRDLCARVQGHRQRYAEGAPLGRGLLGDRLHPATDRSHGRSRCQDGRGL